MEMFMLDLLTLEVDPIAVIAKIRSISSLPNAYNFRPHIFIWLFMPEEKFIILILSGTVKSVTTNSFSPPKFKSVCLEFFIQNVQIKLRVCKHFCLYASFNIKSKIIFILINIFDYIKMCIATLAEHRETESPN
jgi:hypothetical protein